MFVQTKSSMVLYYSSFHLRCSSYLTFGFQIDPAVYVGPAVLAGLFIGPAVIQHCNIELARIAQMPFDII